MHEHLPLSFHNFNWCWTGCHGEETAYVCHRSVPTLPNKKNHVLLMLFFFQIDFADGVPSFAHPQLLFSVYEKSEAASVSSAKKKVSFSSIFLISVGLFR